MGFDLDAVKLGQFPVRVLRFSPVGTILPMLHSHAFICRPFCIAVTVDSVVNTLKSGRPLVMFWEIWSLAEACRRISVLVAVVNSDSRYPKTYTGQLRYVFVRSDVCLGQT